MRQLTITLALILIVAGQVLAQFPNWGWAPPLTITSSGSSITCTVTDPKTNQTKSTTKSGVNSYIYKDGVVVWSSSSSTYAMVYDYNLSDWQWDSWYAPDNAKLDHGIVTMQSGSQTYAAIYDPNSRDWEWDSWYATGAVLNDGGIVAFQSGSQTYAAAYDATSRDWKWDSWYATEDMWLNDGVVAFQSGSQTYAAVYDPVSKDWDWDSWYATGSVANSNGVVAFQSASQTYAATFDFNTRDWKWDSWYETGSFYLSNGTLFIDDNGNTLKKGYNASARDWRDNEDTDLICKMFVSKSSGDDPLMVYLTYMAIGASSNNYNCSDGHQISNRFAWKQFDNSGSYSINLNVYNNALNNNCSSSVTVTGGTVGVNDLEETAMTIYPNPTTGLFVIEGLGNEAQQVRVYNSLGEQVVEGQFIGGQTIDLSDKPAGIYYVRVDSPKGLVSSKLIKR